MLQACGRHRSKTRMAARQRRALKRTTSKALRAAGRRQLDDAPRRTRFKGYDD